MLKSYFYSTYKDVAALQSSTENLALIAVDVNEHFKIKRFLSNFMQI